MFGLTSTMTVYVQHVDSIAGGETSSAVVVCIMLSMLHVFSVSFSVSPGWVSPRMVMNPRNVRLTSGTLRMLEQHTCTKTARLRAAERNVSVGSSFFHIAQRLPSSVYRMILISCHPRSCLLSPKARVDCNLSKDLVLASSLFSSTWCERLSSLHDDYDTAETMSSETDTWIAEMRFAYGNVTTPCLERCQLTQPTATRIPCCHSQS